VAHILKTEWWLMDGSLPDLNWARMRVFTDGGADVFDCDGQTHVFDSEVDARYWLLEDEFVRVTSLEADDLAEYGLSPDNLVPPTARGGATKLPSMFEPHEDHLTPTFSGRAHATLLLVVEDTFEIRGRGLIVVPGPHLIALPRPHSFAVELHRPDGTRDAAQAALQVSFSSPTPPPDQRRYVCMLAGAEKADVPRGTELWFLATQ